MTSPIPRPSTAASPDLILQTLRAHLIPHPILAYLPTVLNLFAHLQLLSDKIQSEAIRALTVHVKLVKRLNKEGCNPQEQVRRGALNEREGNEIISVKKRREEAKGRMLAFSLEFRKHHAATLLSTPKIPFGQVEKIIESYFPKLQDDNNRIVIEHPALYIRCMACEQIPVFDHYGKVVRGWYERAKSLKDGGRPPLLYVDLYIDDKVNGKIKQDSLCKNILREAEKVLEDMEVLRDIFGNDDNRKGYQSEGDNSLSESRSWGNIGEVNLDESDGEEDDAGRRYTKAEKGKAKAVDSDFGQSEEITAPTLPSKIYTPTAFPKKPVRPSTPPPTRVRQRTKPLAKTFTEVAPSRSCQPPQQERSHETIDLTDDSSRATPPSARSDHSSQLHFDDRRKTLPSTLVIPIVTNSSPNIVTKKRPRQPYPLTGPDFTAPAPKVGGSAVKEKLRPFENSELPRAKRTKV
ncbi:hypothetical protein L486_04001 [Kwoniella mangroviensis CBS 10435]|uniref:Uncharacterized protein n=1 Tax=Kwoniella mangroviensis CBS 10435 TaxID=1331196 RepID=A0A1B9IQZ2_9TREE|nr:hypothetical protein L486_04001 [Kwoniella mangroviensis CBS 10435]